MKPELVVNGKGVTTMTYDVFRELDHSALCQALGIRPDPSRPKRSKQSRRRRG